MKALPVILVAALVEDKGWQELLAFCSTEIKILSSLQGKEALTPHGYRAIIREHYYIDEEVGRMRFLFMSNGNHVEHSNKGVVCPIIGMISPPRESVLCL